MEILFNTYAYFVLSLFLLILAFLALILCPRPLRGAVLLSGLFSVPSAFASLGFVPSYWDPVRIAEFGIGPEDAIFSFSTGVIVFLMALWPIWRRIHVVLQLKFILFRLALCYICGILINTFLMNVLFLEPMQSALLTIGAIGFGLAILQKELIILSVYGVVSFTFFYTVYMKIGFLMFPEFLDQWNLPALCGICPLGIPLEEIAWAAACGIVWPMIAGFIMNLRIIKDPQHVAWPYSCD